jgi:hypothetical protein
MLQPAHTIRQRPTIVECLQLTTKRLQLLNAPLRVSFSPGERMQEAKTTPYNQLPAFSGAPLCVASHGLCASTAAINGFCAVTGRRHQASWR